MNTVVLKIQKITEIAHGTPGFAMSNRKLGPLAGTWSIMIVISAQPPTAREAVILTTMYAEVLTRFRLVVELLIRKIGPMIKFITTEWIIDK